MKLLTFLISGFLLITTLVACKKSTEQTTTPTPTPTPPPVIVPQGNYSGQYLTLSTVENVASPWTELKADTVYTGYNLLSGMVKAIPTGLEDKIISFYLPKDYMVVFTENLDGTGESATFVAKDSAIKANLPTRLRNNISYIRYIKINNPDKKGTGSTNAAAVQNFTAQWYYGWSIDKASFTNQQFVPMTWGKGTCTDPQAKYLVERKDVDHLLSFNEPDNADQSNVPVDTAIARYKIMMKTGLRLGSPVTTQDQAFGTGKWLTNFMAKAVTQKLRIDYIAVHWYDWGNQNNNAATDSLTAERVFTRFTNYMNNVRLAYPNTPIWLTECNANINRTSETVHKYFMKLSTEWMNNQPFVERYAYFFPSPLPAVNPDNSLTSVAAYWESLPTTKSLSGNIIGDAVLVK
ncbi:glycosyl hydrolase [Sediminibacterium sp.]|uniref:glycosyl hydrolase n=1 Tax=Sediminibacterium sp. TaxID=1917865 RepID=UPI0025DB57F1|nr:glycosyl hydrolase [Sediminibacterium sp.]MBT9484662.1 hypothetical protein [Sediminibacterium sp.]